MKNRMIFVGTLVLVLVLLQVGVSRAYGPYAKRCHYQRERIVEGVRCGELTRREYRYLENEQRWIQRFRRHSLADGWLSRGERRHLQHLQDRASGDIYRARHNRWNCDYPHCSPHAARRGDRRRCSCSDGCRPRLALGDPTWGFSGFFYDRWQ